MLNGATVEPVHAIDLRLEPWSWAFAQERRDAIDGHWRTLQAARPGIWNGAVVLAREVRLDAGRLDGRCFLTDYASYIAWRDWGWPDRAVTDCFAAALIFSRDGALLYGRMADTTLNPGHVYPPSGALDPDDVGSDGRMSMEDSMRRELREETGLRVDDATRGPVWGVRDGCRLCLAFELRFDRDAETLRCDVERHNASQIGPELDGVEILRGADALLHPMPAYARAVARRLLR